MFFNLIMLKLTPECVLIHFDTLFNNLIQPIDLPRPNHTRRGTQTYNQNIQNYWINKSISKSFEGRIYSLEFS